MNIITTAPKFLAILLGVCSGIAWSAAPTTTPEQDAKFRAHVTSMMQQRLGPFADVRWFCSDGSVLPPVAYACRGHGGGRQHGRVSETTSAIRAAGIPLAYVLAELSPDQALADDARLLKAILLEQYLQTTQDGWIYRQARYARGALQSEDEVASATRILNVLAARPSAAERDYLLLREAARRLPHAGRTSGLDKVRAMAGTLADRDNGFATLRNKIHSKPDAADAAAVRAYAASSKASLPNKDYAELAKSIDTVYSDASLPDALDNFGRALGNALYGEYAQRLRLGLSAADALDLYAQILTRLRERFAGLSAANRLHALELSLLLEDQAFAAARSVNTALAGANRQQRLASLGVLGEVLFGSGLISQRERSALAHTLQKLAARSDWTLADYRAQLAVLERIPSWAANRLGFYFNPSIRAYARIEPLSEGLIPDRLRGSAALSYGEILEELSADADTLSGIRHQLFGKTVSSGIRALNPGLARGVLGRLDAQSSISEQRGIVLVPESIADLPPVAGILTAAEGNALSHVQLLARNLGVPNVVIGERWLTELDAAMGKTVVLAASNGGVVRLSADGPQWDAVFRRDNQRAASIQVDVSKLDLSARSLRPLNGLRASDSGVIVGPKAAKLGELKYRFPDRVSAGLALPFGSFRALLDRPMDKENLSVFEWMKANYQRLNALPQGPQRSTQTSAFLSRLRQWILTAPWDPKLLAELRSALKQNFGEDGQFGVFVRSDTNVEDLPGFTGAGLNLTVPNVVGFEAIVQAIREVWASPFSERAFGWRQALMDQPEHVYAAVLLHKTIPADLSGVMITADLASGNSSHLTVASNEGVGGGVEGQASESLRIAVQDGHVELLATATESLRRVVLKKGGTQLQAASGQDSLLNAKAIAQLLEVAKQLPEKYPQLLDAAGQVAPADVEFAFEQGHLYLNQIRPFLQSDRARRNDYLLELDAALADSANKHVNLREKP